MGAEVILPDDLSGTNAVDPGQLVIPEGDGERVIPANVQGLQAEIARLRARDRERVKTQREIEVEREALRGRVGELEPLAAQLEALKPKAERWDEYERTKTDQLKHENAEKLKALTPEQAKAFEGITDESVIARMLSLIPTPAAGQATQSAGQSTALPPGGNTQRAGSMGSTLTAEEVAFRDARPILAKATDDKIRELFAIFRKK